MKKISFLIITLLILTLSFSNISNARVIRQNKIDSTVVGGVNVSLSTINGNDQIYFDNWYKVRENTLHFGFEELQVNLLWSYYAEEFNSTGSYDLYINLQANEKKNNTWIEIHNGLIETGELIIEIQRKFITIINYNVSAELYKDDVFLDSDNFNGRIIIISIRSHSGSNYPIIMLISKIIKNLFF